MLYDKKWDEKLPVNNFKTAKELGLLEEDYNALVKTLALFEAGAVPTSMFDMRVVGQPACGTPGCLLGWARTTGKGVFAFGWDGRSTREQYYAVSDLFSPNHCWATAENGATALRNYLTTGDAQWMSIYRASKLEV